jgi:cysteine sulfinate desulfinase/cysteine desulfurase-like protein
MEAIRPGGEQTGGSIRLTLGRETTEEDVDETVRTMREIVADLRNLRGVLVR